MSSLSISLTPELVEIVNEKIQSGRYHSANEVIMEGLRLLDEHDEARSLDELRQEIQKGIVSLERGDAIVFRSGAELAAYVEAEGQKILAERRMRM